MDFYEDKIDEFTLALLYLVSHDKEEGFGARAWKGFDWGTLNRLHEKGFLGNPVGKAIKRECLVGIFLIKVLPRHHVSQLL